MATEAQYAAATALFNAISSREGARYDRGALLDLYPECLATIMGTREPSTTRKVEVACPSCGESSEVLITLD